MAFIRLDQKAYEHNLTLLAKKAGGFHRLICVFKNNAYGHGVKLLAPIAKSLGVNFIALKNQQEALELQGLFPHILILSHRPNGDEKTDFIYALNDKEDLHKFKKGTSLHLAIDTGMHRNGISLDELEEVYQNACDLGLKVEGIFTHFAGADEYDSSFFVQKQKFQLAKEKARKLSSNLLFHSHNSAALLRCESLDEDELCRVGLAQFGYSEYNTNLQKVLSLYAQKLSSRVLQKGQSVGYGGRFSASKDIAISTYDLGYADGLFCFDGTGELKLANGEKLLGRMSMDSFSCRDLGDEVCVFNDARVWANFFHTIEYEILVKLSPLIPRILC
ncbi:alanine racemase [Campylobacter sp. MIT 97-5078]|uniref:alanine racemase n=1 Tax=Campylobacter sp. MIT 97-5078 TaxID=1548153 RepID=UPI000514554C|nr:alanine racemase [Campylobacter sp. MIT 97-5078]KGI56734.1 alanine racemase [Campylobacter sp. MIT 97-5078]KGI57205.1 alanine racemase [Campylobacter sp. MIT 97-5078]